MSEIEARVAAGAALLDKHLPGWAERVSPTTLRMDSCMSCVLGQLWGAYEFGLEGLMGMANTADDHEYRWALQHGFTLATFTLATSSEDNFAALTDLWRLEIAERLEVPRGQSD